MFIRDYIDIKSIYDIPYLGIHSRSRTVALSKGKKRGVVVRIRRVKYSKLLLKLILIINFFNNY